jgi:Zn ribbon nucleic-acid-binding protein
MMKVESDIKPVRAAPVCPECDNRGVIKMWRAGRPETTHMVRCEQCSGFSNSNGQGGSR